MVSWSGVSLFIGNSLRAGTVRNEPRVILVRGERGPDRNPSGRALTGFASPARPLRLARAAGRSRRGLFGAERVVEFERAARDREPLPHRRIVLGEITHRAAIFERQPIGVFEVDRLSPAVIDNVGGFDALGAQLVALLG